MLVFNYDIAMMKKCKNYQNWNSYSYSFLFFLIFSGGNFVYEVAMLLHRDFVDAEQMTMSFFRVGRTGGEAEMSRDGEAVECIRPVAPLQDVDVDVWVYVWRRLGTGWRVVVVDILDLLIWIWLFFLFI